MRGNIRNNSVAITSSEDETVYGPEGNSKFFFPESPDVSRDEVVGKEIKQKKVLCYIFRLSLNNHTPKKNKQTKTAQLIYSHSSITLCT